MESNVALRIQALERTVDIISRHLLITNQYLQQLINELPDCEEFEHIRLGLEKNIDLLGQVKKLSKQ